jgi:heat shock protein HtpX
MTIVSAISMVAYWIVRWGWIFDDGGANGGENSAPHFLVAFAASLIVWIASFFILRILSRYREYAADRGAASITSNPTALVPALRKIDSGMAETPDENLREKTGMSALLFMEIDEGRLTKWFQTHPDIDERINRLSDLQRQL